MTLSVALTLGVAGLIVLTGAVVQGSVGYGMNLLGGPLLMLIDPMFVPVPTLLLAVAHTTMGAMRERAHTDWRSVGWALIGRLPGNFLGLLALVMLPLAGLNLAVAVSVLVCVGLSLISWRPVPTPRGLIAAGTASGAFGTTSAIGGPPIALLYQNVKGPTTRATLSAYFVIASLSSVGMLAVAGEVHTKQLLMTAALLPFMFAGFWLSSPLRKILDGAKLRYAVLGVASTGAAALLVRTVLG